MSTAVNHIIRTLQHLRPAPARILEAGCGDGQLLSLLHRVGYDVYGFDLKNFGLQDAAFFERCHARLPDLAADPARLKLTEQTSDWPFEQFEVVVSNQVLEHVSDHDHFFANHFRVLKPGGFGLHVFPAREVLFEFHLNLPLAHRIANKVWLERYVRWAGHIRLGKAHKGPGSLQEESRNLTHYLSTLTNYKTTAELAALARHHGLQPSYTLTPAFYAERMKINWKPRIGGAWPWKYIANVTLVLTKPST